METFKLLKTYNFSLTEKKMITLVVVFFSIINIYSQDNYSDYYSYKQEACKASHHKKYQKAIDVYKKAFESVDYSFQRDIVDCAKAAIKINNLVLADTLLKKAVRQGYDIKIIKNKWKYRNYFWSNIYKKNSQDFKSLFAAYEASVNHFYQNQIDSLLYVDQLIRKNIVFKIYMSKEDQSRILAMDMQLVDDALFYHLNQLIKQFGFPSEKNIGITHYHHASTIIHHNARLKKHKKYQAYLKEKIISGEYRQKEYDFMMYMSKNIVQ